jgi:hypothetical protein
MPYTYVHHTYILWILPVWIAHEVLVWLCVELLYTYIHTYIPSLCRSLLLHTYLTCIDTHIQHTYICIYERNSIFLVWVCVEQLLYTYIDTYIPWILSFFFLNNTFVVRTWQQEQKKKMTSSHEPGMYLRTYIPWILCICKKTCTWHIYHTFLRCYILINKLGEIWVSCICYSHFKVQNDVFF